MEYTENERKEITHALKAVLVATAEFWDALRVAEVAHGVEIEYSDDMIGQLAGDLRNPPSFQDISDADVWETFVEGTTVNTYARKTGKTGFSSRAWRAGARGTWASLSTWPCNHSPARRSAAPCTCAGRLGRRSLQPQL